ncbi:hypothetical protein LTSEGIV_4528, partial [Salmonella enterica subsp. enterica serovar Give str. S5-487]
SRILVAQLPGGMLTNLEGQLKQQNAADKLDQVLAFWWRRYRAGSAFWWRRYRAGC